MEISQSDQNAVLLMDPNTGIILDANQQSEDLLEKNRNKIIGLKIDNVLFDKQNKKAERFLKKIKNGKTQSFYFITNNEKGDSKQISIKTSGFQIKDVSLIKCTLREVTQKIRIEDFLLGTSSRYFKLEELINQGPIIIFICLNKKNWPMVFISENISKLGYSSEDFRLETTNFLDLIHPDDIDNFNFDQTMYNDLDKNGFRVKCRIFTKTGEIRWVVIHVWIKKDITGTVSHRLGIIFDITKRKQAEEARKESEERFKRMADNIHDGLTLIENKEIIYVNDRICEITGYSREELVKKTGYDLAAPEEKDRVKNFIESVYQGSMPLKDFEYWIIRKDGSRRYIHNRYSHAQGDKIINRFIITTDITERKLSEEKLRESEIKYRLAYNKANFYKDLFAHDMSNILHNILSSVELYSLCQKFPEKLEKGDDLLEIVKEQAIRGGKLISNVHKLSKLEDTELPLQKIDMLPYLKEAFKFVENSFPGRNIKIILDPPIEKYVILANELILDVFENLLINSVKYNNKDPVLIHIKISQEILEHKKYIKLQFIDNGIGIPDSRKEAIFQRSINEDKFIKGMGIGLSLVRSILSSFYGHITVEDNEAGNFSMGSNFIIFLPDAD